MPSGSFQDYLSAAVQLKTALIKAKPGRQEWEQAPPFLRCTASAIERVQAARLGDFSIQHGTALHLKEQGNELVSKDPESALERYTEALSVFLWFDRGPDKASEDVPLVCAADKLEGAEREQAYHLLATCFCNAAACLLQLGMLADAVYACNKALHYDPYSVKALYRRAMAHRQAETTAGLEAAVEDLAAANQLEPANNQVRLALLAVQHELREHRRRERGLYGNMFKGGELYGGQGAESAAGGDGHARGALKGGIASPTSCGPGTGLAPRDGLEGDGEQEHVEHDVCPRDPEDQQPLDPQARKVETALASQEADLVMRRMRQALALSRNRKMAERLDAERARRAVRFPWWAVPWWAYALIGLHLAYRLIKIWRLPLPSGSRTEGASPAPPPFHEDPLNHAEL